MTLLTLLGHCCGMAGSSLGDSYLTQHKTPCVAHTHKNDSCVAPKECQRPRHGKQGGGCELGGWTVQCLAGTVQLWSWESAGDGQQWHSVHQLGRLQADMGLKQALCTTRIFLPGEKDYRLTVQRYQHHAQQRGLVLPKLCAAPGAQAQAQFFQANNLE